MNAAAVFPAALPVGLSSPAVVPPPADAVLRAPVSRARIRLFSPVSTLRIKSLVYRADARAVPGLRGVTESGVARRALHIAAARARSRAGKCG
ncbi:hypothetical protein POSPLADRAFT_1053232 [Postia placenta MAD-698-R-SB12]|uniref:Uncharacterized protein n=1 Tax=Postia placenta MAD-698-R-SB12 TaxID=670580 RepID=A0A1X6NDA7_9APHY|nr:hypothetical protein POSPLADRAFT_1053232 [Postia placenta MAD-698-R-SB12]OSX66601.1 hypothetical protein POSPLADRAFT_1053232 [Postia placenta MAD-698-R-SB12]